MDLCAVKVKHLVGALNYLFLFFIQKNPPTNPTTRKAAPIILEVEFVMLPITFPVMFDDRKSMPKQNIRITAAKGNFLRRPEILALILIIFANPFSFFSFINISL